MVRLLDSYIDKWLNPHTYPNCQLKVRRLHEGRVQCVYKFHSEYNKGRNSYMLIGAVSCKGW